MVDYIFCKTVLALLTAQDGKSLANSTSEQLESMAFDFFKTNAKYVIVRACKL
jgi:hypothetical protein